MNKGLTIFVCFIVITPLCVCIGWQFWKYFILERELARIEAELQRREETMTSATSAPAAATGTTNTTPAAAK